MIDNAKIRNELIRIVQVEKAGLVANAIPLLLNKILKTNQIDLDYTQRKELDKYLRPTILSLIAGIKTE